MLLQDDLSQPLLKPGVLTVEKLFACLKVRLWKEGWSVYKSTALGTRLEDLVEVNMQESLDWLEYIKLLAKKPITLQDVFCHQYQMNQSKAPLQATKAMLLKYGQLTSKRLEARPEDLVSTKLDDSSELNVSKASRQ